MQRCENKKVSFQKKHISILGKMCYHVMAACCLENILNRGGVLDTNVLITFDILLIIFTVINSDLYILWNHIKLFHYVM